MTDNFSTFQRKPFIRLSLTHKGLHWFGFGEQNTTQKADIIKRFLISTLRTHKNAKFIATVSWHCEPLGFSIILNHFASNVSQNTMHTIFENQVAANRWLPSDGCGERYKKQISRDAEVVITIAKIIVFNIN